MEIIYAVAAVGGLLLVAAPLLIYSRVIAVQRELEDLRDAIEDSNDWAARADAFLEAIEKNTRGPSGA